MLILFYLAQLILIGAFCVLFFAGLYWLAYYMKIYVYVLRFHSSDLRALGVSVRKMFWAELISMFAIVLMILSFLYTPLLLIAFIVAFVGQAPLRMAFAKDKWNYLTQFWWRENENFGDHGLVEM